MEFNIKKIIIGILTAISCTGVIFAVDGVGGATTTVGSSGTLTAVTAQTATAIGGNVTNVDVETNLSTLKWQGFYGNVSGQVSLGSGSDIFYNFGSAEFQTLYVTTGTDTVWTSLVAGTTASVDTLWNFGVASDVDQSVDIFTTTAGTFGGVASVPNATIGNFGMGVLNDGATAAKTDIVFASNINNAGAVGFYGNTYNYQIMVPVETTTPETYYFYVSLE